MLTDDVIDDNRSYAEIAVKLTVIKLIIFENDSEAKLFFAEFTSAVRNTTPRSEHNVAENEGNTFFVDFFKSSIRNPLSIFFAFSTVFSSSKKDSGIRSWES